MSIDFSAAFALAKDYGGPEALRAKLETPGPAIAKVIEEWRPYWIPDRWTAQPDEIAHLQTPVWKVVGPGGFALNLSGVAASMYHCSRWDMFLTNAEHRDLMRRACYELAVLLGSDRAVYHNELLGTGFFDGLSLTAMEEHLIKLVGPPAPSIEETNVDDFVGARCYYIDTFHDFRR